MSDPVARLNAALEGRYAIERELGEGGMATVYLADDLKHERKVGLKVLKPELAAVVGAERFLAEIKTTANLKHPHILPLFDSGEADSFLFYVMPYLEGENLRDRIDREKQLPVDEAVALASKVAGALQHAHEHGVIHRDIKPGNILLQDGEPVVADFGIALALGVAGGTRLTETGLSVGTPFYMSPEQATGDQAVGASTDIYALGSVLYEMLVGEPPYPGATAQAVLGKIIAGKPVSATEQRPSIPANVDAAVRKALEKLPADRFTSAQDFVRALGDEHFRYGELAAAGAGAGGWGGLRGALTAAVVASAVTGGVVWSLTSGGAPEPASTSRFAIELPEGGALTGGATQGLEITRDGRAVVFRVSSFESGQSRNQLFLRRLGDLEAVPIRGTEGVGSFFLSPDGESVGYNDLSDDTFKRIPLTGGPAMAIAETGVGGGGMRGVSWGDAGTIVFATAAYAGLMRVADVGGVPEPLTTPPEGSREIHMSPHFSPGGELLLFVIIKPDQPAQVAALSMETGRYEVLTAGAWPHYVAEAVLVFEREDALWAVAFDPDQVAITSDPVPVLEGLAGGGRRFSISTHGTLVYAPFSEVLGSRTLVWVDRDGQEQRLALEPQNYFYPRISPDGSRVVFAVNENDTDLWVFDLDRGSRSRITFGGNNRFFPVWTPAGDQVAFSDGPVGTNTVHLAAADGSGQTVALLEREGVQFPTSWSRDGSVLAYHETNPVTLRDLWVLPVGGDPEPLLVTPFQERAAAFSPDGRWLAYVSNESGQDEIYVRPYPGPGPQFTVSTAGGREPVWSPDGAELFYRTQDELMVVAVEPGDTFRGDTPRPLFADPYLRDPTVVGAPNYDIMPDGQRFVMVSANALGTDEGFAVILVTNWFEELRQRIGN